AGISRRQNAVEELVGKPVERSELRETLTQIHDLERILSRVVYGSVNPREMLTLSAAFGKLPEVLEKLQDMKSAMLCDIRSQIDTLSDIKILIDLAIDENAPLTVREGGIIKDGFSAEVDTLRADMNGGKDVLARIEQSERQRTGIPKLKVGYNRVFGYYIEVSNSYKEMVPEEYIRKQTLTNCERYITQELKDLEARILGASGKIVVLEYSLFDEIRKRTAAQAERIKRTAHAIAQLDVLYSFAQASFERGYSRPQVNMSGKINIRDGRHPVVEALSDAPFVPNDAVLDKAENRVAIITGPNMAGKSTYMRQIALIVLMAQIGCFVPASFAEIGVCDRIFTRVGASDDLTSGQSTFMVEMNEVAEILKYASSDSLLILDEIGRGTSTYDGMSIARAVLEYVADKKKLGAKTLFATHYHELTALEDILEGVKNYNIAVKKHGDDITFLRRIIRGGADDSYGIEVAKLAGVPGGVINRAKQILKSLEAGKEVSARKTKKDKGEDEGQMTFTTSAEKELCAKLRAIDVNAMTPIEALGVLFELSKEAKQQDE
ncbi:MAG: DNA mismatch repair protein MutS, partial [Clostridia bacterium]|nr:DNA mismatch repair protein MutS [Clostridia bacterium]